MLIAAAGAGCAASGFPDVVDVRDVSSSANTMRATSVIMGNPYRRLT